MSDEKTDRRKNNGGHSTKGKAGRKKSVLNLVKTTVRFDKSELEKLQEVGNYNELLRDLVRAHFGMDSLLTETFDDLAFSSDTLL
jgi:hypothetical protein